MMGCSARCCITVPLPSSAHHPPPTGTVRPLTSPQTSPLAVAAPCGATDGRRARRRRRTCSRHPVRQGRVLLSVVAATTTSPSSIATADAAAAAGVLPPPARSAATAASAAAAGRPPRAHAVAGRRTLRRPRRRLRRCGMAQPGGGLVDLDASGTPPPDRPPPDAFGSVPRASAASVRRWLPLLRWR